MAKARKIAMVAPEWGRWLHRFLAGALQFANIHPHIVIRPFARYSNQTSMARELENWGADGILGGLQEEELLQLKSVMDKPVPIVNCFAVATHPGVVSVVSDLNLFLELALEHLRDLELRHFAILATEPSPKINDLLIQPFLKLTQPHSSALGIAVDRSQLMDPESNILPVPQQLTEWLLKLPKPTGVICPGLGCGPYLIRCCAALGLKVPEEIAVLGSDDTDLSLSCAPTLTSIVPAIEQIGMESLRILLKMTEGALPPEPRIRLKAFDLVVRESTGRRRPGRCDIAGALDYIERHATKGITVRKLMKETQEVSAPTFHQCFQEATGKSPGQVISERQLAEAKRLLSTTALPISMVSELAGFSSANVMARCFQRTEGITPRSYRKQSVR
jgi:LacI family transcriptional regulator